jgi:hypothetical protein
MDILGPLPETKDGHRFLLVIVDRFSKHTRTVPLKNITAEEVSKAFVNEWYCIYGAPIVLLSVNGTQFVSKFFQSVCRLLGVKQVFTTAYHPASNGQCERFNRTVLSAITHYISDNQDNWNELSYTATYAYNTTVQSSTGYTPFELTLARTSPSHVLSPGIGFGVTPSSITKAVYREKFLAECERLGHRAAENLKKSQERYKRTYDADRPMDTCPCLVPRVPYNTYHVYLTPRVNVFTPLVHGSISRDYTRPHRATSLYTRLLSSHTTYGRPPSHYVLTPHSFYNYIRIRTHHVSNQHVTVISPDH